MKLTPDQRHHLEVQYLASRGVLCEVMDEWVKHPLLDDKQLSRILDTDNSVITFLNYAFMWDTAKRGGEYWLDIDDNFEQLLWRIQNEIDP